MLLLVMKAQICNLFPLIQSQTLKHPTLQHTVNKNITAAIKSWPSSCFIFVSYQRCCQHNWRRVLLTGVTVCLQHLRYDDGRTILTTPIIWQQSQSGSCSVKI